MASKGPCYNCPARTPGCHSVCESYKEWSEDRIKQKIDLKNHSRTINSADLNKNLGKIRRKGE